MFGTKKLREKVEALKEKIKSQETVSVVICDTCGCLVARSKAIEGKGEIRHRTTWGSGIYAGLVTDFEKYIHTPYYCGRCAPKEEKRNDRE